MGAIHEEKAYGILIRESADDGSDFPNPAADYRLAFIGEDGKWHVKDSAGSVADPYDTSPGSVTGNVLTTFVPGANLIGASGGGSANTAYATPISIPGPMRLRSARFRVHTGGTGTVQWGLFDYSSSATACAKLAGGSGVINATGWQSIAAAGGPVDVGGGNYMLIMHLPSSNNPLIFLQNLSTPGFVKSQGSYVWDDTPDLTSGWSAINPQFDIYLLGDLDGTNQW